jgi:hypothetical protein
MLPAMKWLIGMFFRAAAFAPNSACWPSMIDVERATVFLSSFSRLPKLLMMMSVLSFLQRAFPIVQEYSSSLVPFSGFVLPTSDQVTSDSHMTLAMIDCHHNV